MTELQVGNHMTRGAMELIQAQLAGAWDKRVETAQRGAPQGCDCHHASRGKEVEETCQEAIQPILDVMKGTKTIDASVENPPSLATLRSMARSLIAARDSGKGPVRLT